MQRGFGFIVLSVLGGAAVAVPPAPAPAVDAEDITVIARKLRKVRLDYRQQGSRLVSCLPDRKSGDARIGRVMCAVLRACIEQKKVVDVSDARQCIDRRLDSLGDVPVRDIVGRTAMASPPTRVATPAVPTAAPVPPSDIVVTGRAEDPDIVVTASGVRVKGGLWTFRRSMTLVYGSPDPGNNAPSHFSICIPDGGLEETLRRAAGEGSGTPRASKCGRMRMTIAGGRISGSRSCTLTGLRGVTTNSLQVSGRYDAKTLTINFGSEEDHDGIERTGGGPARVPQSPVGHRWRVTAERSGACPAARALRQVSSVDAVDRIFAEGGSPIPDPATFSARA